MQTKKEKRGKNKQEQHLLRGVGGPMLGAWGLVEHLGQQSESIGGSIWLALLRFALYKAGAQNRPWSTTPPPHPPPPVEGTIPDDTN